MGVGKFLHYIGSVLLFVAMILTIVVNISAPVVDSISFVTLDLNGDADAKFGVFGYCSRRGDASLSCSDSSIGYNPAGVIEDITNPRTVNTPYIDYSNARGDTIKALTRVFVLHPIGTVVLFLGFLLSLLATSTVLSILAMLVTFAAFIINAVALVIDFVAFTLLGNEINDNPRVEASYGPAAWIQLVATVMALIATIILFVTCCAGRRRSKRESRKVMEHSYEGGYGHHDGGY